jgi:hypothetical protein
MGRRVTVRYTDAKVDSGNTRYYADGVVQETKLMKTMAKAGFICFFSHCLHFHLPYLFHVDHDSVRRRQHGAGAQFCWAGPACRLVACRFRLFGRWELGKSGYCAGSLVARLGLLIWWRIEGRARAGRVQRSKGSTGTGTTRPHHPAVGWPGGGAMDPMDDPAELDVLF